LNAKNINVNLTITFCQFQLAILWSSWTIFGWRQPFNIYGPRTNVWCTPIE